MTETTNQNDGVHCSAVGAAPGVVRYCSVGKSLGNSLHF